MIRLSALFSYESVPFVNAIQRISSVQFEWLTYPILCDSFSRGQVDGILCPPLMALSFPESLIVPGVGIATMGGIPSPLLQSKKLISEVRTVFINEQYVHWEDWLKTVLSLLNSSSDTTSLSITKKEVGNEDGFLIDGLMEKEKQEGMYEYNLGELWKQVSIYPMVCWVWLCRGDSDYKQIRSILGHVWDEAKENLIHLKRGTLKSDEIPKEFVQRIEDVKDVYYNLASLEFEGIHWLLEQAKKWGVVPKDIDIHIC